MMIVKHNGRETETYADHFPVADMPAGTWVTVTLTTGGKWVCVIELARPDYILLASNKSDGRGGFECGGRIDIGDVATIELGKP